MAKPSYYIAQVAVGRERAAAHRLTRALSDVLAAPVVVPSFEAEAKVRGTWVPVTRAVAQGYVALASSDGRALLDAIAERASGASLVQNALGPIPVPDELAVLLGLAQGGGLPISRGVRYADGAIHITEGPLKGMESSIRSLDRRRCTAVIEICVGGERIRSRAGLALLPAGPVALAG